MSAFTAGTVSGLEKVAMMSPRVDAGIRKMRSEGRFEAADMLRRLASGDVHGGPDLPMDADLMNRFKTAIRRSKSVDPVISAALDDATLDQPRIRRELRAARPGTGPGLNEWFRNTPPTPSVNARAHSDAFWGQSQQPRSAPPRPDPGPSASPGPGPSRNPPPRPAPGPAASPRPGPAPPPPAGAPSTGLRAPRRFGRGHLLAGAATLATAGALAYANHRYNNDWRSRG